jgi:REP element-mobilizing transposase RayT
MNQPLAFFITFRTYGTWLHGDDRGSMDREHNGYGEAPIPPNVALREWERGRLTHPVVVLGDEERTVVGHAIAAACGQREWKLLALNVRTNHVHVIVTAPHKPELALNYLKSRATLALRTADLAPPGAKVWSRHGSTRYLWTADQIEEKCAYVLEGQ